MLKGKGWTEKVKPVAPQLVSAKNVNFGKNVPKFSP